MENYHAITFDIHSLLVKPLEFENLQIMKDLAKKDESLKAVFYLKLDKDRKIADIKQIGDVDDILTPHIPIYDKPKNKKHFGLMSELITNSTHYQKYENDLKNKYLGKTARDFLEDCTDNISGIEHVHVDIISDDEWRKADRTSQTNLLKLKFRENNPDEYIRRFRNKKKNQAIAEGRTPKGEDELAAKAIRYKNKDAKEIYNDRKKNKKQLWNAVEDKLYDRTGRLLGER